MTGVDMSSRNRLPVRKSRSGINLRRGSVVLELTYYICKVIVQMLCDQLCRNILIFVLQSNIHMILNTITQNVTGNIPNVAL